MIREVAILTVAPENMAVFEARVAKAKPLFLTAEGCHGVHLERVIEVSGSYRLIVEWETVEHHTEMFRGSVAFEEWRALVGLFFIRPPEVVHTEIAVG